MHVCGLLDAYLKCAFSLLEVSLKLYESCLKSSSSLCELYLRNNWSLLEDSLESAWSHKNPVWMSWCPYECLKCAWSMLMPVLSQSEDCQKPLWSMARRLKTVEMTRWKKQSQSKTSYKWGQELIWKFVMVISRTSGQTVL